MKISRRNFLAGTVGAIAAKSVAQKRKNNVSSGASANEFQPTWASLANYETPDWFRNAKLGIWAHWSAQCVPEQGDWYARHMYMQGHPHYEHHVKNYGHPTKSGFIEIDNLWKAEHWDPEHLISLYKKAGARYFVALANHHDNFDNYNSKHHAWNSVNIGPKRDIIGTWAKVARANGLRFGVSNHSSHAWHWFQTAYGYDGEGELAGVRYDAATLKKTDGSGRWWNGLDPQELYTGPNIVIPDGIRGAKAVVDWHNKNDGHWFETPPPNNPEFAKKWFMRCQDLLDSYRPDLIYFDDTGLPLEQTGLDIVAHYYNSSIKRNGGKLDVVVNAKKLPPEQRHAVVEDYERGFSDILQPLPWQTDTCIGDWHYKRSLFEQHKYKSARTVITQLCDIVSKNGNLLLSIPVRGDGTIDEDEVKFVEELTRWTTMNGEAIFDTRPWRVYGEGPTEVKAGAFGEGAAKPFTAGDIRYTTKGPVLYALLLGWPETRTVTLSSLKGQEGSGVSRVELLGANGPLKYKQTDEGLRIEIPENRPGDHVYALKIRGSGLTT